MKERPILFSGPMVRAILAGTKTQTRRAVKYDPALGEPEDWCHRAAAHNLDSIVDWKRKCPFGTSGDRLWVRESFFNLGNIGDGRAPEVIYMADFSDGKGTKHADSIRWKPSIHMPRRASRFTLEVTGVRVERLQDISEADCIAEGIEGFEYRSERYWRNYMLTDEEASCAPALTSARDSYRSLWESINGPGAWAANPWVWVIEFRRLQ